MLKGKRGAQGLFASELGLSRGGMNWAYGAAGSAGSGEEVMPYTL
jgi:hypothetical protein